MDNTILVLHQASLDPADFINRLTGTSSSIGSTKTAQPLAGTSTTAPLDEPTGYAEVEGEGEGEGEAGFKWTIDNKYYTAQVVFQPVPLGGRTIDGGVLDITKRYAGVEVVLYLFEGSPPLSLHPTLIKLLASPRDIALAIRVLPHSTNTISGKSTESKLDDDVRTHNEYEVDTEELFGEIGMEFIDEIHPLTEEDDERPLEPLELIRQTLMTHLWSNMVRKPLGQGASSMPMDQLSSPSSPSSSSSAPRSTQVASFPITFASGPPVPTSQSQPHSEPSAQGPGQGSVPAPTSAQAVSTGIEFDESMAELGGGPILFPGLDELRAAIHAAEFEALDKLDRLDDNIGPGLKSTSGFRGDGGDSDSDDEDDDDGAGPSQEEYARLEDWLDEDDDEFEPRDLVIDASSREEAEGGYREDNTATLNEENGNKKEKTHGEKREEGDWLDQDDQKFEPSPPLQITASFSDSQDPGSSEANNPTPDTEPRPERDLDTVPGFEDDFDADFAPFQSAPTPPAALQSRGADQPTLALDPTPLLLHLQSVRSELAGVENEDERRVRAGREVAQILASLGIGGDDMDLDFDEDLGDF